MQKQVQVKKMNYDKDIDLEIIPMLDFLNEHDMETTHSCSGHFDTVYWNHLEQEERTFLSGYEIYWSNAYIALKPSENVKRIIDFFVQQGFECSITKRVVLFDTEGVKINWKLLLKKLKKYYECERKVNSILTQRSQQTH